MSRTDKTDPLWVRMADPANRSEVRIVHDHRFGPCDLDAWEPWMAVRWKWWFLGHRCSVRRSTRSCSCRKCRGVIFGEEGQRRAEWVQERQAWKAGWGEYRKSRWPKKYWYD